MGVGIGDVLVEFSGCGFVVLSYGFLVCMVQVLLCDGYVVIFGVRKSGSCDDGFNVVCCMCSFFDGIDLLVGYYGIGYVLVMVVDQLFVNIMEQVGSCFKFLIELCDIGCGEFEKFLVVCEFDWLQVVDCRCDCVELVDMVYVLVVLLVFEYGYGMIVVCVGFDVGFELWVDVFEVCEQQIVVVFQFGCLGIGWIVVFWMIEYGGCCVKCVIFDYLVEIGV